MWLCGFFDSQGGVRTTKKSADVISPNVKKGLTCATQTKPNIYCKGHLLDTRVVMTYHQDCLSNAQLRILR